MIQAISRQRSIFTEGLSGKRSQVPFRAEALRDLARLKMSARAWAYIDGGAGNEETIQSNHSVFSSTSIRPRMMHPNDMADFSSTLLGTRLPFPLLLAPIGVLDLICPRADLHVARQCAETSIPFIFSNQAGTPMEVCAEAMGDNPQPFTKGLIIVTLVLAWLFSNMIYALHYAHVVYMHPDIGCVGLEFPRTPHPVYWDFVYFAFTCGMAFATSDVQVTSTRMRRMVTIHCLAAFAFNIGVLAFTINVLGGS